MEQKEEKKKKKKKKWKSNGCEESGRRIDNLGWERRSSEIRERGKKVGAKTFSLVDLCLWKEGKWKDVDKEVVEPYNRD